MPQLPYSVSRWFNDNKRIMKIRFAVQHEDPTELGMHRITGRWQHAKIDYARPAALAENEGPKITVPCYEQPSLFVSHAK
jgi:hypothetical protein